MLLQVEVYAADGFDTLEQCIRTQMMDSGNHPQHQQQRQNSKRLGLAVSTRATEHFETFFSVQLESFEQMFYGTARDCEVTVRF